MLHSSQTFNARRVFLTSANLINIIILRQLVNQSQSFPLLQWQRKQHLNIAQYVYELIYQYLLASKRVLEI